MTNGGFACLESLPSESDAGESHSSKSGSHCYRLKARIPSLYHAKSARGPCREEDGETIMRVRVPRFLEQLHAWTLYDKNGAPCDPIDTVKQRFTGSGVFPRRRILTSLCLIHHGNQLSSIKTANPPKRYSCWSDLLYYKYVSSAFIGG